MPGSIVIGAKVDHFLRIIAQGGLQTISKLKQMAKRQ